MINSDSYGSLSSLNNLNPTSASTETLSSIPYSQGNNTNRTQLSESPAHSIPLSERGTQSSGSLTRERSFSVYDIEIPEVLKEKLEGIQSSLQKTEKIVKKNNPFFITKKNPQGAVSKITCKADVFSLGSTIIHAENQAHKQDAPNPTAIKVAASFHALAVTPLDVVKSTIKIPTNFINSVTYARTRTEIEKKILEINSADIDKASLQKKENRRVFTHFAKALCDPILSLAQGAVLVTTSPYVKKVHADTVKNKIARKRFQADNKLRQIQKQFQLVNLAHAITQTAREIKASFDQNFMALTSLEAIENSDTVIAFSQSWKSLLENLKEISQVDNLYTELEKCDKNMRYSFCRNLYGLEDSLNLYEEIEAIKELKENLVQQKMLIERIEENPEELSLFRDELVHHLQQNELFLKDFNEKHKTFTGQIDSLLQEVSNKQSELLRYYNLIELKSDKEA